jgi:hypothetical protein
MTRKKRNTLYNSGVNPFLGISENSEPWGEQRGICPFKQRLGNCRNIFLRGLTKEDFKDVVLPLKTMKSN